MARVMFADPAPGARIQPAAEKPPPSDDAKPSAYTLWFTRLEAARQALRDFRGCYASTPTTRKQITQILHNADACHLTAEQALSMAERAVADWDDLPRSVVWTEARDDPTHAQHVNWRRFALRHLADPDRFERFAAHYDLLRDGPTAQEAAIAADRIMLRRLLAHHSPDYQDTIDRIRARLRDAGIEEEA
jgi:hypothetical protein